MLLSRALPFALLASFAACLEVEEDVTVRSDGSVVVVVKAKGDRADLEDGFPVPTWGAWRGADKTTVDWLCGAPVDPESLEVELEAEFRDVAELPQYWAPPGEPYRSAGLSRTTELDVTCKGSKTIYVFTRVVGTRRFADWSPSARIDAGLDDELRGILEARGDLSEEQWKHVTALVRAAYEDATRAVLRSALAGVYTRGAAELGVDEFEHVVERVALAVGREILEPRLHTLYFMLRHPEDRQREEVPAQLDLDAITRKVVRQEFPAALEAIGLAEGVRNAVLESLEWSFTALDQTTDLGDESLALRLALPGRIVDGNFDSLSDGRAVWKLDGSELHDRDVVLRAVSVLE